MNPNKDIQYHKIVPIVLFASFLQLEGDQRPYCYNVRRHLEQSRHWQIPEYDSSFQSTSGHHSNPVVESHEKSHQELGLEKAFRDPNTDCDHF